MTSPEAGTFGEPPGGGSPGTDGLRSRRCVDVAARCQKSATTGRPGSSMSRQYCRCQTETQCCSSLSASVLPQARPARNFAPGPTHVGGDAVATKPAPVGWARRGFATPASKQMLRPTCPCGRSFAAWTGLIGAARDRSASARRAMIPDRAATGTARLSATYRIRRAASTSSMQTDRLGRDQKLDHPIGW
jgi:hypothetical protein